MHQMKSFWADESGPSAVEYAVMLALIVLASVGAIGLFGSSLLGIYLSIRGAIDPI